MKVLIVTDAWKPQVNGVVRTLDSTSKQLRTMGHEVELITPLGCKSVPCPTYKEISLTLSPGRLVKNTFHQFQPDMIHIATEGPLGWSARRFCKKNDLQFTTSFHTQFPEYIHARTRIPTHWTYQVLRRFHSLARQVMVTTFSMEKKLQAVGFKNLINWSRGVDTDLFQPQSRTFIGSKPKLLYVGRVAVEKNLEAFLSMDLDAVKIVVGDGPQLPYLKAKYPDVMFAGAKFGEELVHYYSLADAFVFPSRTDTFGLVMLEALACGTPVAAYPVEGPIDVIQSSEVGCLDKDLKKATLMALRKSRKRCRELDYYGERGFGAIAITDHLCESKTFLGQSALYLQKTLVQSQFDQYIQEILQQAERAKHRYNMVVLLGVEFTKNSFAHVDSAHVVGLGIRKFIDPDQEVEAIIDQIHQQKGLAIAAHPVPTRKMEHQTFHLWQNRDRLSQKLDAWEVASGSHLFEEVFESGLPMLANSDLHHPRQMSSWKTLIDGPRTEKNVLGAIKNQDLNFTYFENPEPWRPKKELSPNYWLTQLATNLVS